MVSVVATMPVLAAPWGGVTVPPATSVEVAEPS